MKKPLITVVKDVLECEGNPQHFPMAAAKIKAYYGQDAIKFFNSVNEYIGYELDDDASDKDVCAAIAAMGKADEDALGCLLEIIGGILIVELLDEVTKEQANASNN